MTQEEDVKQIDRGITVDRTVEVVRKSPDLHILDVITLLFL